MSGISGWLRNFAGSAGLPCGSLAGGAGAADVEALRGDDREQDAPADEVEDHDHRCHAGDVAAVGGGPGAEEEGAHPATLLHMVCNKGRGRRRRRH